MEVGGAVEGWRRCHFARRLATWIGGQEARTQSTPDALLTDVPGKDLLRALSHATMEAQTGDPEQEEDEPTTLLLRPGQGAPAPNELTSSADEAEYDDDASKALFWQSTC